MFMKEKLHLRLNNLWRMFLKPHPHINQQYWFIYNHSNLTIILILEEMILILDWFHCFLNKPVEGDKLLRIDKPQLTILKG